uniref:Sugar phosphate exchanger 3 n=1 Tax=Ciona savignyi TaxID=51511 RepID=H2YK13_CIOSA
YQYSMLILTFFCYMTYHLSRKPFSVVKSELHQNCTKLPFNSTFWPGDKPSGNHSKNGTWCDFPPFDKSNYKGLFGDLDSAFLLTYAIGMFFSGMIAERVSLRYFLSIGMILCGIFTSMFGLGYFGGIHSLAFYLVSQVLNGLTQTSGWPGVVTCVGNWFGKQRRGLIMGIWNSHTSFGNILGSVIASIFVGYSWGLSFIVPGIIIATMGVICFLLMVDRNNLNVDITTLYCPTHGVAPHILVQTYTVIFSTFMSDPDDMNLVNHDSSQIKYQSLPKSEVGTIKPIGFIGALRIPGVIEFSLCLLFAKLVSYTFLFWLPFYLKSTSSLNATMAGLMSTLFDIGGIFGGITAGLLSDHSGACATTCSLMLLVGAGMMYLFNTYASVSTTVSITLLIITGAFVNGPYALITTAVSADLGTHEVLKGNAKALSTVTAIIDGTGSIGAAIGPYLTGVISKTGWKSVFYMLIAANFSAMIVRLLTLYCRVVCLNIQSENSGGLKAV